MDFINTVSTANYNNLANFKRFAADDSVQNVNMIEVMRFIRAEYIKEFERRGFGPMFTEMGLCFTTISFRWYGIRNIGKFGTFAVHEYHSDRRYGYLDKIDRTLSQLSIGQRQNITIVSIFSFFTF